MRRSSVANVARERQMRGRRSPFFGLLSASAGEQQLEDATPRMPSRTLIEEQCLLFKVQHRWSRRIRFGSGRVASPHTRGVRPCVLKSCRVPGGPGHGQ